MFHHSWKRAVAISLRHPVAARFRRKIEYNEHTVFQEVFDCLDCGECCHARDGTLLLVEEDITMWKRLGESKIIDSLAPGHFGQLSFAMTEAHRCIFQGTADNPYACSIYEKRAAVCRTFEKGCDQCLDIRRNRRKPLYPESH